MMAAPTVPKSKANANLNSIASKEKSKKSLQKHVLCPEIISWPRPEKSEEESILSKLSLTLKGLPNIFRSKKKTDTEEDVAEKQRIRSQVQIGVSSVLRSLERDDLQCVLVSGKATPAITVDHVISLGRDRSCPLLCLDGLSPTLALALDSKSLPLCIGFRKLEEGVQSDFAEVISLVKEYAPYNTDGDVSNNWTLQVDSSEQEPAPQARTHLSTKSFEKRRTTRIDPSDEVEILADVKRVFSSAINEQPNSSTDTKKKKKKHKARKNPKEPFDKDLHSQFEAGKRTVVGSIQRGRLELVLVSQEVEDVVNSSPMFQEKNLESPPVIVLPGLTNMLRDLTAGACTLSFLGIKKLKLIPADSNQDFKNVIELCNKSLRNAVTPQAKPEAKTMERQAIDADKSMQETGSGGCKKQADDKKRKDNERERMKGEDDDDEEEEDNEEEEDYSYFYTMKEDSKDLAAWREELKADSERIKKDASFGVDFISFGSSSTNGGKKSSEVKYKSQNKSDSDSGPKASNQKNSRAPSSSTEKNKSEISVLKETASGQGVKCIESFDTSEKSTPIASAPQCELRDQGKTDTKSTNFISFSAPTQQPDESSKASSENLTKNTVSLTEKSSLPESTETLCEDIPVSKTSSSEIAERADGSFASQISEPSLFLLDRKGGDGIKSSQASKTSQIAKEEVAASGKNTKLNKPEGVLGAGDLKPCKGREGLDVLAVDAAARSKTKTKALKRKLDQEAGFISFKYTEANIKTMVANPSKKKKKKKK